MRDTGMFFGGIGCGFFLAGLHMRTDAEIAFVSGFGLLIALSGLVLAAGARRHGQPRADDGAQRP